MNQQRIKRVLRPAYRQENPIILDGSGWVDTSLKRKIMFLGEVSIEPILLRVNPEKRRWKNFKRDNRSEHPQVARDRQRYVEKIEQALREKRVLAARRRATTENRRRLRAERRAEFDRQRAEATNG